MVVVVGAVDVVVVEPVRPLLVAHLGVLRAVALRQPGLRAQRVRPPRVGRAERRRVLRGAAVVAVVPRAVTTSRLIRR